MEQCKVLGQRCKSEHDNWQSNIWTFKRSMKPTYLSYLLELLQADQYKGVSENIDIAKGKYHMPKSWDEFLKRR